jgi:hypothetical protein
MVSIQERLERLENDRRFLQWLHCERFLEGLSDEQLEVYARHGCLPDPLPEPLPIGASRLDRLDRKTLIGLWQENEREFGDRSQEELDFFCAHGHWPGAGVQRANLPESWMGEERTR